MKELAFEEALKALEKITDDLEAGDISLDISLKKYEEGMKLVKICYKKLEDSKKKVELLIKKEGGKLQLKSFDTGSLDDE